MIKDKNTTLGYHCPHCGISILNTVNMFSFSAGGNLIKLKCPCGASELSVNVTRDKKFRLTVPCIVCPNSHCYVVSANIFFEREIFAFSCKFTALSICFIGKNAQVMEAMRKNEQELLQAFSEYDDTFDPETAELSDIFADEYDDEWFEEMFGDLDDEDELLGIEELLKMTNEQPGFELYKNEGFDADKDGELDFEIYSEFTTHRSATPEKPAALPVIELDNNIDASNIKLKNYPIVMQILNMLSQLLQDGRVVCGCDNFDGSVSLLEDYVRIGCKKCGAERSIKSSGMADVQYMAELGELFLDLED